MREPVVIRNVREIKEHEGKTLGVSDWITITQDQIDRFAEATGDHQWIHVDPGRAERESPFKQTIAHGFLTLSLAPYLLGQVLVIAEGGTIVNTGLQKVKLPTPVPVNSRIRLHVDLKTVRDMPRGGVRGVFGFVWELEGSRKPACIADAVFVYLP